MNAADPLHAGTFPPSGSLPGIAAQHVDEAMGLFRTRAAQMKLPDFGLAQLLRLDRRIAAHLDGVNVAGPAGVALCDELLEASGNAEPFVAIVCALECSDLPRLDRLLGLSLRVSMSWKSAAAALGWTSASNLRGIGTNLLQSSEAFHRWLGLHALAMHRVASVPALVTALGDQDLTVRACALKSAGELGMQALLPACLEALADPDPGIAFESARAAWLLGDRHRAHEALLRVGLATGSGQVRALMLLLRGLPLPQAGEVLHALAQATPSGRLLLRCIGASGDINHLQSVVRQMQRPALARVAGEAFCVMTGVLPDAIAAAPTPEADTEDAEYIDDCVDMDFDEALPLPDPEKVTARWHASRQAFVPSTRYFMGRPVDAANCALVLRDGTQRQRIAAAEHLTLLKPGTPLFNCAAPAWRQQRWLSGMDA